MSAFNELIILGLSEPTLSMVFDNLESHQLFPSIKIVNNLGINSFKLFKNDLFEIELINSFECNQNNTKVFLGVNKPNAKSIIHKLFISDIEKFDLNFINIIHRSSSMSSTVELGKGVHIMGATRALSIPPMGSQGREFIAFVGIEIDGHAWPARGSQGIDCSGRAIALLGARLPRNQTHRISRTTRKPVN